MVDIMGIVLGVIGAIVAIGNTDYCSLSTIINCEEKIWILSSFSMLLMRWVVKMWAYAAKQP